MNCEVEMIEVNRLPDEAHLAFLKRDEAIRKALEQASQHTLSGRELWFALANAVVLFFSTYFATNDPFVAFACGVSVSALTLAATIFRAARKMQSALLALIEVSRDKEGRKV